MPALNRLASGCSGGSIKIWDIESKQCVATLQTSSQGLFDGSSGIIHLQLLPDNKLLSASKDGNIKVWDIITMQCKAILNGHREVLTSLQLLSNKKLASSSSNGDINIWDISRLYEEQQILNNLEQKIVACKIM